MNNFYPLFPFELRVRGFFPALFFTVFMGLVNALLLALYAGAVTAGIMLMKDYLS